MGANEFSQVCFGTTPGTAFSDGVKQAQYDYGHAGYTGSMAEKGEYVFFELPKGWTSEEFEDAVMNIFSPWNDLEQFTSRKAEHVVYRGTAWGAKSTKIYKKAMKDPAALAAIHKAAKYADDKWGPAVGVPLTAAEAKKHFEYRFTVYVNGEKKVKKPRGIKGYRFFGYASS